MLLGWEEIALREAKHFWLEPERVEDLLDFLCATSQQHAISFRWRPFLSDPDDDFVLELAVTSRAQYIVMHNLRNFAGIEAFGLEAITPAELLRKLNETNRHDHN